MTFLRESAIDKVRLGISTLKEINKVTFIEGLIMASALLRLIQDPPPDYIFELSEGGIAYVRPGSPQPAFEPLNPVFSLHLRSQIMC